MPETFLRTFSILKPLAPGITIVTSTNTTATAFKLVDSATTFDTGLVEIGWIVVNDSDGGQARIVDIEDANTLILDKNIFPSGIGKTFKVIFPSRDVIVPGTGQELILFKVWAANPISANATWKVRLFKEGFDQFPTYSVAETDANNSFLEITDRLLPTDTEYYVVENSTLERADMVVEGLDKTLNNIQSQGTNPNATNA